MPVLNRQTQQDNTTLTRSWEVFSSVTPFPEKAAPQNRLRTSLLLNCANPDCRSGWLHLTRSRSWPIFENGWTCSPECTGKRLLLAVRRELEGRSASEPHRHRVPLGLLMLKKGWISANQLKQARQSQRRDGGRIGNWLVRDAGVTEDKLTQALAQQWSRPVLSLGNYDPETVTPALPRLFAEAFALAPLRLHAGGELYLAYAQDPDPVLEFAIESMTGTKVQGGFLPPSQFAAVHQRYLEAAFPPSEFLEAISVPALVRVLTRRLEANRPWQSRLVRVHDWLWLRMWLKRAPATLSDAADVRDILCVLPGTFSAIEL